ncbi:MAG TPA: porin [Candidatus Acidoferrales bacterium]|nr:porin [Candidatus Acidoferrales bacterium]
MNRMKCFTKWAMAIVAVGLALGWAPTSRAEDKASETAAAQPAPATSAAAQPAAAQPTSDQRLEELEKEVTLLEQEIASLKTDSEAAMKTAALVEPAGEQDATKTDTTPKVSIASLLGPVTLSGFGDVYYGYDYNHPGNNLSPLRFFEAPTNGFNFNMAELILDKAPDATSADSRLGYHISAGYGQAAKIVNGSDSVFGDGSNFFVKEAYLSYLAPVGKGLTVTVGKFVTNAGAEVIESNANWNYSRSLLFYYAIPYFHFGAKAAYTFNPKWSVNVSLVNGWNNTNINHTSGGNGSNLTYGGSVTYTPTMKWSVIENYYAGPVIDASFFNGNQTINDWKQLSDTVIGYTPNTKWAFQVNGDYGFGPRQYSCPDTVTGGATVEPQGFVTGCKTFGPQATWWGVAGYAKYTLSPKTNFAVRYEYYEDPQAYTGLIVDPFDGATGFPGHAQEVTGTYSYNLTSALLVRGEYRYDFASLPVFMKGPSDSVKEQNTAYISFVYSFSSANMK